MRRILTILSLLLALGIGATFNSCSKDNEDDPENIEGSGSKAKKFVGTWCDDPNAKWPIFWTFKSDGSCIKKYPDFYGNEQFTYGQWNYDDDSKVLVTTLGMEWDILTITDDYWTGRYYSFNEGAYVTYTYVRVD